MQIVCVRKVGPITKRIGAVLAALAFLSALIPPGGQKALEQQSYPMASLL